MAYPEERTGDSGNFLLKTRPFHHRGPWAAARTLMSTRSGNAISDSSDALVIDPYEYWHRKRFKYPKLSRMALDLLTVPPMSAECERLFSTAGLMVTKIRNRLEASTIGLCQTLRSWLRVGLITSLDRILMEQ